MNFYDHHINDYAEATSHLSFIEDAAYSRMIRKYYATEKPLPADVKAVQRLIGARTKEERDAVQVILDEFFTLQSDGWHNKRCDEVLDEYHDGAQDRELKKDNERDRKRRSRERRKRLFDELRSHGVVPKFDASIDELEQHLSRVTSCDSHAQVTPESHIQGRGQDADGTASQFPLPSSHSPVPIPQEEDLTSPSEDLLNVVEPKRSTANATRNGLGEKIPSETIQRVFDHWRTEHGHLQSKLDDKRRKLIATALHGYSEADLCQAISGYRNSPHHMGQNDRDTVYDSIELMLRSPKQVDAGLKFYSNPPRTHLSEQTRRIIDQTEDWVPPEVRSRARN